MKLRKMNKKGLEFKLAFFAVIALGLIITAVGVIISSWNETYSSGLIYDLDEFNQINEIENTAGDQQTGITVKSSNTAGNIDFEGTSIRGVYGILNNIYAPFRVVFGDNGMLDSVTERFGIPDYIRQGLIVLMIMAITFALVAVFFRLPRRSA